MSTRSNVLAGAIGVGFIALGLVTPAQADGYAAPRAAYERPFSWTGLYVGANAGWENVNYDQQWTLNLGLTGTPGASISPSNDSNIFGGHVGYQLQYGQLVAGVEVAVSSGGDWTGLHPTNGAAPAVSTSQLKDGVLWTIGSRLGWATSNWLLFVDGGYAMASIKQRVLIAGVLDPSLGTEKNHEGGYLGAGLEYALSQNIILGVEYQHVFLGTAQHCRDARIAAGTCLGAGDNSTSNISADIDLVRARISYKFNNEERARPLK